MLKGFLPDLWLKFCVRDKSGNIIHQHEEKGHSWTRNAYNSYFGHIAGCGGGDVNNFGAGFLSGKNEAGTITYAKGYTVTGTSLAIPSTSGSVPNTATSAFGLVVGSGVTAFDFNDYKLATKIVHGTGSGQLSYGAGVLPVLSYETKVWKSSHVRTFTNLSSAEITVNEVGLIWYGYFFGGPGYMLLLRDILATPISIASLAVLQGTYDLSYDFSAVD